MRRKGQGLIFLARIPVMSLVEQGQQVIEPGGPCRSSPDWLSLKPIICSGDCITMDELDLSSATLR